MFDKHFEVVLVDTESARRIHHQIRYQVYCLDEGFEDYRNFPDGEEQDEWDHQSVHFLVRSKLTDEWVAAMRLVLPSYKGFPVEQLCEVNPMVAPPALGDSVVEVSRLCIVNSYRRGQQKTADHYGNSAMTLPGVTCESPESSAINRRYKSEIVMGLMRAAAIYCREHQIHNWYFLSTPAFARMMNRLGFQLIKLGPACEHRGKRLPFLIRPLEAYEKAKRDCCSAMAAMLRRSTAYRYFSELGQGLPDQIPQRSLVA
jgi:N-acyl amino acid synthase of PEP-CTERM/exosortase system